MGRGNHQRRGAVMPLSPEFEALRLEIVAIKATLTIELENVRTLEALHLTL
jgi:hypothetical protein